MQIGEFAKICGTKISVLRHYDKTGVLRPDYTDRFTGYRYYAKEQIADFVRIAVLRKAGFSLAEIRTLIGCGVSAEAVSDAFERKKAALQNALLHLDEAKRTILGVEQFMQMKVTESKNGLLCRASVGRTPLSEDYRALDSTIAAEGYQRISAFTVEEATRTLCCRVAKLNDGVRVLREDIDLAFENEDTVIGKWETVGVFAVREDFLSGMEALQLAEIKTIYFLPGGERYWCFSWTKGKLLIDDEESTSVNPFETKTVDGERYMLVSLKSYEYRRGGEPTVLVLRQVDNHAYTAEETVRKEETNMPFVLDEAVLGRWKSVDFCAVKEDFVPDKSTPQTWYFSAVEFRPDGTVMSVYDYGRDVIDSAEMQTWTKGFLLRHWNHSACAYEIRVLEGREYLFLEWKSGDYRWGGFDTDYYVFERA